MLTDCLSVCVYSIHKVTICADDLYHREKTAFWLLGIKKIPAVARIYCLLEAAPRFELGIKDLQSSALPLGYAAAKESIAFEFSSVKDITGMSRPHMGSAAALGQKLGAGFAGSGQADGPVWRRGRFRLLLLVFLAPDGMAGLYSGKLIST